MTKQNKTIQSKPKATEPTLLEHRPDVLGSGFIVQVLCGEFEGVEETFYLVCWLVLQDFNAAFHVYLGGLVEGAVGMDVVVEDDDSHHHPHAEEQRVLAAETSRVLRRLQHDLADAGHGAETVGRVLQRESFIL